MNPDKLLDNGTDRGAAPVVGVILLVAITVVLAAGISAYVLDEDDQTQPAPQASFDHNFNGTDGVTITHTSGDDIDRSTLSITANGSTYNASDWGDDAVGTGDEIVIDETTPDEDGDTTTFSRGDTVRIIWATPGGGESNTLSEREWP